jgi:alkanesulfonate monooxygenase SsuD/methylene tetrahydromethanopterin reductase-like flavin-dependent oxidoreductase (luciferase family)
VTILGAVFPPSYPPERLRSVAQAADQAGLEQLWLWEDCFREGGISAMAAALAWTERLQVGIGVLPVPLRNVALTAMEVAALERMFPDRAIVGVGHGVISWMEQVGAAVKSPMTLLREYVTALRALLRGELVTVSGRYINLDRVALDWPPAAAPQIHCAATGPRTLQLVGEVGDGTVLSGRTTPQDVRAAVALIDAGRASAGRTDAHPVTVYIPVATGSRATEKLAADKALSGGAPDAAYGIAGDAAAVADAIGAWVDAGATTIVLQPTVDEPDPEGFVRFVAEQVRPLVS